MKIRYILFAWLFSLGFSSVSQNTKVDSLKMVVGKLAKQPVSIERDSLLTVSMYTICSNISLAEPDIRQTWTDSLHKFSKTSKWEQSIAYSHAASGRNYHYRGYTTLSMKEIGLAIALFKKFKNDKMYSIAFFGLAVMITNFIYNKPIADEATEKKYLNYLLEALALSEKQGNIAQIANMNLSLMQYYMRHKNHEKAKKYTINAWKTTEKDHEKYFYYYYVGKFLEGLNLLYLNKPKEGFKLINETKAVAQKPRKDGMEKYFFANEGLTLGNYYIEQKDYTNALIEAKIAADALKSMKATTFDFALNKIFYETYKNTDKPKEALLYFEKMQAFEQEEQHKEALGKYLEWQLKYEDEKQKNKIQNLENQQLMQTRNFMSLVALLGLSVIGYVFFVNKKLRMKNEEIQEALLAGQTMERKRMASELHDNIANKILGLKMRMEMLENEQFTPKERINYDATIRYIDEVYADIRLISHNLLPEELEQKGLIVAVENLVRKVNLINRTQFDLDIHVSQQRFSLRFEYEIYSIMLELVNNILKHAQAKNAIIAIFEENQVFKFSVKDDGKGFDSQLINFDSLGIKSIRSRIESLKGKIKIDATNGTSVEVEMPVSTIQPTHFSKHI